MPTASDLVTDLPADFEVFGQAVDTSLADLKGGTTDQVLAKNSNTDMDFKWVTSDDANAIQNSIVDAKGDLIAASANDTPARLAVGNNGETLVADSSTSTGLRYQVSQAAGRNAIINGNVDIWQRGTSFTGLANGAFAADRFAANLSGTTISATVTQDTSIPNVNSKYSIKVLQATTGATSLTEYCLRQNIEQSNALPLLGKACVLSFWYKSNKTGSHAIRAYVDNTGGGDQRTTFTVSVADTWEFKQIAITAFSTVSAASVAPTSRGGLIDIGFCAASTGFSSVSANDYFQVAQVQLEVGSVATSFTRAGGNIQGELAACQRYYFRANSAGSYRILGSGYAGSGGGSLNIAITLPTQMRVIPTALDTSALSSFYYEGASGGSTPTTLTLSSPATENIGTVNLAKTGSFTAGDAYWLYSNNTAAYLGFSAEL